MTRPSAFEIAVLPGDGIGVEVTTAALEVVEALAAHVGGFRCVWRQYPEGRVTPFEFGGSSGTAEITRAVVDALRVNARER